MNTISPLYITAQFISEEKVDQSQISIHPKGDHGRGYASEIISIKENKKEDLYVIEVRWQSLEEKLKLEEKEVVELFRGTYKTESVNRLPEALKECWLAIDEELARPRVSMAVLERIVQLGTSSIKKKYWNIPVFLNEEQEAIYCYFMPYADHIKNNESEMAYCFSTFLARPVEIRRIERKLSSPFITESSAVDQWQVGLNSIVGGFGKLDADEIKIIIDAEDEEELKEFLPNRPKRLLMEEVLFPAFVDGETKIKIELKIKQKKPFKIEIENSASVGFSVVNA